MVLVSYRIPNVFTSEDNKKLYTKNLVPGEKVYNEDLILFQEEEYRSWNPFRSKLAALILKGEKSLDLKPDHKALYLGAASGTTPSHLSDILTAGRVYCVEFSERPFRDLISRCEGRKNMIPILANARKPDEYKTVVEKVDILYQDISQRDQIEIFLKNFNIFLKAGGQGIIMIKSRSIDVNLEPRRVYREVAYRLDSKGLIIQEEKELAPFQNDHAAFIVVQG